MVANSEWEQLLPSHGTRIVDGQSQWCGARSCLAWLRGGTGSQGYACCETGVKEIPVGIHFLSVLLFSWNSVGVKSDVGIGLCVLDLRTVSFRVPIQRVLLVSVGSLPWRTYLKYTACGRRSKQLSKFSAAITILRFLNYYDCCYNIFFSTLISLSWCCYDSLLGDWKTASGFLNLCNSSQLEISDLLQSCSYPVKNVSKTQLQQYKLPKHCPRVKGKNYLLWKLEVCTVRKNK